MPADLNKPFDPSCCDGGECSTSKESAMPCGCDPGAKYISPFCEKHKHPIKSNVQQFACGLQLEDEDEPNS